VDTRPLMLADEVGHNSPRSLSRVPALPPTGGLSPNMRAPLGLLGEEIIVISSFHKRFAA
jgi:hypothetical protein